MIHFGRFGAHIGIMALTGLEQILFALQCATLGIVFAC